MRLASLLTGIPGIRRQGWIPVNDTEQDETGMDELMRMAMEGDYDDIDNNSRGERRASSVSHPPGQSDSLSEPVFQRFIPAGQRVSDLQDVSECQSSISNLSCNSSSSDITHDDSTGNERENIRTSKCKCCGQAHLIFPKRRWYLILLSIFIPVLFISISTGLGVYSLLVYKTDKLVIDKSVKSFSIPNHEVYKNFEAMMLARKDNSSVSRRKREAPLVQDGNKNFQKGRLKRSVVNKEQSMLEETKNALNSLRDSGNGFRKSSSSNLLTSSTLNPEGEEALSRGKGLSRVKRVTHDIGCLLKYQSVVKWKMHVIYLATGPGEANMFTKERLETVHKIERKIMQHPGFDSFCLRDPNMERYDPAVREMNGCVPINSLMTYFYPSKDARGHIFYDGMGSNIDDIESALALAMNHETFYYYVDEKINKTYKKSHLLRSEVLFGAPLPGFACVGDNGQKDVFKNFVITYIDLLSTVSTDKVSVLYGGNEIFDYEVSSSFWSDIRLAIASLVAIFLLLLILSLSLYLTIVGIVLIALSFPISLFFYRVVCGINALGILNGAAAFVIIGIGVDDVFVFVNIYRQSSHMKDAVSRIKYTIKTAGIATFFTSFTTAAAFAANLFSSIPAVYEFGLFMSLIVSSCWISVFLLMPPLLYLHACCIEPLEKFLFSCFTCSGLQSQEDASPQHPSQLIALDEDDQLLYIDDDDVPLLHVDEESRDSSISQDVPLLGVEENIADTTEDSSDLILSNGISNNNMCLGRSIQRCLMFLTHRIVIPAKYFVIGFYLVTLVVSCLLMSRLQPSTHPPQLFRPETNLQRLLDLKANFSIIDALHCDRCSGLYKVSPSPTHLNRHEKPLPTTPPVPPSAAPVPPHKLHSYGNAIDGIDQNHRLSTSSHSSGSNILTYAAKAFASKISQLLHPSSSSSEDIKSSELISIDNQKPTVRNGPGVSGRNESIHISKRETTTNKSAGKKTDNGNWQLPFEKLFPFSPKSLNENFNVCKEQSCNHLKDRPLMESGATVYVVFGIKGLKRSQDDMGHVLDSFKGRAIFDSKFADAFNFNFLMRESGSHTEEATGGLSGLDHIRELCRVCHYLANQTDLVKEGSAQCLPSRMSQLHELLLQLEECRDLPHSLSIYHHQAPAHAEGGLDSHQRLLWLAFAFESTTQEGQAYFQAYKQYQQWEEVISHIKHHLLHPDSPLQTVFQTSEFWTKVMMEVVAVNSAIYGLILSMLICIVAVAVFTGHIVLLLIVIVNILVMICCVVGIFYLVGWEMGAVEAVSLSILVGSSVDYCVHLVEGYILAGRRMTGPLQRMPKAVLRRHRTSLAVRHIGVAIVCSSLTTIMAAVPLTQTFIQPFTKFGFILLINTSVSMVVTLTLASALLAAFAPACYRATWKSHFLAFLFIVGVVGLLMLVLYVAHSLGVDIPGPSGSSLFA